MTAPFMAVVLGATTDIQPQFSVYLSDEGSHVVDAPTVQLKSCIRNDD